MTSKRFSVLTFSSLPAQLNLKSIQDVRAALMRIINAIIEENAWSQLEAGKILGTDQPTISHIKCLNTFVFALKRLFSFLHKLNCSVNLVVKMQQNDITIIKIRPDIKDTKLEIINLIKPQLWIKKY